MLETRTFGIVCPTCRHTVVLGKVLLAPNAHLSDLRYRLTETNWQAEIQECTHPGCKTSILPHLGKLLLL